MCAAYVVDDVEVFYTERTIYLLFRAAALEEGVCSVDSFSNARIADMK